MFRPLTSARVRRRTRPGAMLIVVLALLALFAIVAISFVFYSDSEATSARIYRESQTRTDVGQPDASDSVNTFLASFLFGAGDTSSSDLQNAMRGHDLMRTMYGWGGVAGASVPFNGVGTFHEATGTAIPDRVYWVNNTAMTINGTAYLMDPEWSGGPRTGGPNGPAPTLIAPLGRTYIPKNAPYTYPDANNLFLAALSPGDGSVLVPSFYRPWIFRSAAQPATATGLELPTPTSGNPNWYTAEGRAMILRPRPVDQLHPSDTATYGVPYPFPPNPSAAQVQALNNMIAQGQLLPYPPANAPDPATNAVTYTGDVQNLWGGVGVQQNDSILMDLGLAPRVWNGKLIKPLVAALITDLDGRLNVNAHGNLIGSYAGMGPWEVSLAPVLGGDAAGVLNARYNGQPVTARTTNQLAFDKTGAPLPLYGLVNWNGSGTGNTVYLPGGGGSGVFTTALTYAPSPPGGFTDGTSINATESLNHPGLYNPNEWPATPGTLRTFPLTDLKRLNIRYADQLAAYQSMSIASATPTSLVNAGQSGASYRLDPTHANRFSVTPLSASLDRPGLMPNFALVQGGQALQLTQTPGVNGSPSPWLPMYPGNMAPFPFPGTFPTPGSTGAISDFGATDMRNQRAVLGPLDLNRPLTDYFTPVGVTPLVNPTPGTVPNVIQAWADRHNLARDIFARLIVATGAAAYVDTATGNVWLPQGAAGGPYVLTTPSGATVNVGQAEYNALRYLAQLAANIVDYIDKDDVSTVFIWNPPAVGMNPPGVLTQVTDPSTLQLALNAQGDPTALPLRVVFGVEKPKLVINEAYSELTNDPTEKTTGDTNPPSKPAHVRFWVELLNPTSTPYNAGATGPQNGPRAALPGAVEVRYDAANGDPITSQPNASPYKLVVVQALDAPMGGQPAWQYLQDPTNVTGGLPTGLTPRIIYDFTTVNQNMGLPLTSSYIVGPNNGQYGPNLTPTQGAVVAGPQIPTPAAGQGPPAGLEFNPLPAGGMGAAPWMNMIQSQPGQNPPPPTGQPAMEYLLTTIPDTSMGVPANLQRHVVLLRRLANPYLAPNDPNDPTAGAYNPALPINPYVTVDYMDYVPSFDALFRGPNDMNQRATLPTIGTRFSLGKIEPYAGLSFGTIAAMGGTPTYTPQTSCVLAQNPAGYNAMTATYPMSTFWQHNGTQAAGGGYNAGGGLPTVPTETIVAPGPNPPPGWGPGFDPFIHLDRPLVNQLDLLQVQAGKPHEVTQLFLWPAPLAATPRKGVGHPPWLGVNPTTLQPGYDTANGLTHNGLFRALEVLRTRPWGYGVGMGGRIHGRININTVQDLRVLMGLVNEPSGNITSGTTNLLWAGTTMPAVLPGLITNTPASAGGGPQAGSRTPNSVQRLRADGATPVDGVSGYVPLPGPTADDMPPGGVPNVSVYDRPFKGFGAGEFSTGGTSAAPLGSGLQDSLLRTNAGQPLLWLPPTGQPNSYLRSETARKILNSTTTVSNTFAVYLTVVYFEVRKDANGNPLTAVGETPTRYLLGREAFKEVPGDLRQQFFAVVDRTNVGLDPNSVLSGNPTMYTNQPFFTSLELPAAGLGSYYPAGSAQVVVAAANGSVYADGTAVSLTGQTLVIGVGSTAEVRAVAAVAAGPVPGTSLVTLSAPLTYSHYPGESVANVYPGNPGPQPGFDRMTNSNSVYKYAVPYLVRAVRQCGHASGGTSFAASSSTFSPRPTA